MISSKYFDHTILKAEATEAQVAKICEEALAHDFASVCVNQYYTKFVAEKLKGSDVSEDEIKDLEEDLQKLTDKYVKEVDKAVEVKSKEIMTV